MRISFKEVFGVYEFVLSKGSRGPEQQCVCGSYSPWERKVSIVVWISTFLQKPCLSLGYLTIELLEGEGTSNMLGSVKTN